MTALTTLFSQLAVSTAMILATATIHGIGLSLLIRAMAGERRDERAHHMVPMSLRGMAFTLLIVLGLFALHGAEIWLYAALYDGIGAAESFDKLNKQQQDAVIKAGKDAQKFYEGKADAVNEEAIKAFKDHKVEVTSLSDAEYNAWIDVAKKSAYAKFEKDVPNGKKLIDEALAVK